MTDTAPTQVDGDTKSDSSPRRSAVTVIASSLALALVILIVILAATGALAGDQTVVHNAALASSCNADAKTIETAVAGYDANPPVNCTINCSITTETIGTSAGDLTIGDPTSYGLTTNAQALLSNGALNSWSDSSEYSISLSPYVPGEALIYVPANSTNGVPYDDETSTTGCNAL